MGLPVTYLDITYSESRHRLSIPASIDEFDDAEGNDISLVAVLEPRKSLDEFFSFHIDGMLVRSAVATPEGTWTLGKYGEIWGPGDEKDSLPDSGFRSKRHLGPPKLIRNIGG